MIAEKEKKAPAIRLFTSGLKQREFPLGTFDKDLFDHAIPAPGRGTDFLF